MWIYHGSPVKDIKQLRAGSYVTIFPHVAYNMGLSYTDTNKTWQDADLAIPYDWGPIIKFKPGRKPNKLPTLYRFQVKHDNIILLPNFPYEFRIKKECKVELVHLKDISDLIKNSKRMYNIMETVNFQ